MTASYKAIAAIFSARTSGTIPNSIGTYHPHSLITGQSNMRKPKYMSPSSLAIWKKDPEAYYLQYLAENRPAREPQTAPMAVGSAFDAYIKADLYDKLVGDKDPKYSFEALFEKQVEPHNRTNARKDGKVVFDAYIKHGGQTELMIEMQDALTVPRFEIDVESVLEFEGKSVSLLGKPDVFFVNKQGAHCIFDWKVNGFYSSYKQYPKKGYVRLLPGRRSHKDCIEMSHHGIMVNRFQPLEELDVTWAAQLSIYAWLCGCKIGSDWIAGLEQLVCTPDDLASPTISIAQHRMLCGREFQEQLARDACEVWEIVNSDWIFRNLTPEASQARCQALENRAASIANMSPAERDFLSKPGR